MPRGEEKLERSSEIEPCGAESRKLKLHKLEGSTQKDKEAATHRILGLQVDFKFF